MPCGFYTLNDSMGFLTYTMHNSFSSQGNIFLCVELYYMHTL